MLNSEYCNYALVYNKLEVKFKVGIDVCKNNIMRWANKRLIPTFQFSMLKYAKGRN